MDYLGKQALLPIIAVKTGKLLVSFGHY